MLSIINDSAVFKTKCSNPTSYSNIHKHNYTSTSAMPSFPPPQWSFRVSNSRGLKTSTTQNTTSASLIELHIKPKTTAKSTSYPSLSRPTTVPNSKAREKEIQAQKGKGVRFAVAQKEPVVHRSNTYIKSFISGYWRQ
jgi:hypothetical protein